MRGRRGVTFVETLIILAVVTALLVLVLLMLKPSRAAARSGTGTLADLRRIDAAKDQYATEHHKKTGDPVTMAELVNGGYLLSTPKGLPPGTCLVVGNIGTPATIAAAHSDDEEDQHR